MSPSNQSQIISGNQRYSHVKSRRALINHFDLQSRATCSTQPWKNSLCHTFFGPGRQLSWRNKCFLVCFINRSSNRKRGPARVYVETKFWVKSCLKFSSFELPCCQRTNERTSELKSRVGLHICSVSFFQARKKASQAKVAVKQLEQHLSKIKNELKRTVVLCCQWHPPSHSIRSNNKSIHFLIKRENR